ncbi:molybdopterin synthase catalytic subunit isoform X2 [Macrobrachium rosenbergii]|uniref:molybdopterin synthase catalytic subunit isoform X2 n=1 Tax=Macrobrachium rosenbergii TaxID=79674 RepID=UPI0034D69525
MDYIKITEEGLSVDEITKLVTDSSCGAISLFVGTTRDTFEGQAVVKLEYESYKEMAEKEMIKLCKQAREKWPLHHIAVHHRLGVVPVSEASVILAVSSVHRRESLEAVSYLIDELKANVPIWKKEVYDDGSSNWKQNKECVWLKEDSTNNNSNQGRHTQNNKSTVDDELVGNADSVLKKIKTDPEESLEHTPLPKASCIKKEEKNVDFHESSILDPKYVQIVASKGELTRRIQAFQKHKRQEIDVFNVQEFCTLAGSVTSHSSCARTSAVVLRSKDSNSHLKLTRVVNEWGPQTLGKDPGSVKMDPVKPGRGTCSSNCSREGSVERMNAVTNNATSGVHCSKMESIKKLKEECLPPGIDERLVNLENHLKINCNSPVPCDVYARLKALEDRVLRLEAISPEYFHPKRLKLKEETKKEEIKAVESDMSLDEVNIRIHNLKMKLKERQLKHVF